MIKKIRKLLFILFSRDFSYIRALFYGVVAGVEHTIVLREMNCATVVDLGANRGQFALVARHCFADSKIISFEPLKEPASVYRRIFAKDRSAVLQVMAIGSKSENRQMHVSARDDSSSLLPISSLQNEVFPDTAEAGVMDVKVAPLDAVITNEEIAQPALLKLDVQGFELEALRGCESLLSRFDWIYCECSFVELYIGQSLAAEIIAWLMTKDFRIVGIYNPVYDRLGRAIQADFLFSKSTH